MTRDHVDDADLVQIVSEMAVATQTAGVRLLQAEMRALAQIMPGMAAPEALPTQAAVEEGFENMPV